MPPPPSDPKRKFPHQHHYHSRPRSPPSASSSSSSSSAQNQEKEEATVAKAKRLKVASSSRPYEYGITTTTATTAANWITPDAVSSPTTSKPADLAWRAYPAESPLTPAFPPYTPHAAGPAPGATWSEGTGRDDMTAAAWGTYPAPPARSLSFGAEGMTAAHAGQYPPPPPPAPAAGGLPGRPVTGSMTGMDTVSTVAAGIDPSTGVGYASWPPPTQGPYGYGATKPGDGYAATTTGWYEEGAAAAGYYSR